MKATSERLRRLETRRGLVETEEERRARERLEQFRERVSRCNARLSTIWPSVIWPVTSGTGCVRSSPRHSQDGYLGHRTRAALRPAATFEDLRQIGIEIARIGNLPAY
jgi:hypothetical protein